jgi:CRP/FNR family transcriptional regulator, cyclic AMP receptor protein
MRAERAALDRCDLFQPLSGSERAALFAHARPHKYAANESIFLMGSPGDDMVAVVSGTIRISVPSPDGKEIVLAILGPGEICGEIALLDGKERTADANAATECGVVVLERRDVLAFLAKYPDTWTKLIGVFCARMRAMDHQLSEFAMTPMPVRLAKALLRLANPGGHAHDGGALESIRLTQRELGSVIGATRESVNKHLRVWQRKGWVRISDRLIVITNRADLEDLAVPEG